MFELIDVSLCLFWVLKSTYRRLAGYLFKKSVSSKLVQYYKSPIKKNPFLHFSCMFEDFCGLMHIFFIHVLLLLKVNVLYGFGFLFFIKKWIFVDLGWCLSLCLLILSLSIIFFIILGFVKPICRARVSKMAQLALKVGDNNSDSPCLSNIISFWLWPRTSCYNDYSSLLFFFILL